MIAATLKAAATEAVTELFSHIIFEHGSDSVIDIDSVCTVARGDAF